MQFLQSGCASESVKYNTDTALVTSEKIVIDTDVKKRKSTRKAQD